MVYFNIPGASVSDLLASPAYPESPSEKSYVTDLFESPTDIAENYGQRMRGFIAPPATGDYQFWIATDDGGALYLSTDADPANKVMIASVSGWAPVRDWFREGNQQSAPIRLESGRLYYIEALQKEAGGGDNLAVRWLLPNGTMEEPIPGSRLRPWGIAFTAPAITVQPQNASAVEGGSASFSVSVSNIDPLFYQWQRNGANIAGANSPTYTRLNVALADDASQYRCFLSNSVGTAFSNPATLTVTPDQTPPAPRSAQNSSDRIITLVFTEAVETASATSLANYQVSGGVTLASAILAADNKTVSLTATAPLSFGTTYTVTVSGVKDRAATANVMPAPASVSFAAVEYIPVNIGGATGPNQTVYGAGGFNVTASGQDIAGTSDQFRFDYQQRTGDFDVRVRVQNLSAFDMWTKAGLMARDTLDANARFVGAFATPSLAGAFQLARATVNGAAAQTGFGPVNYPNTWLRVRRVGSTFTTFVSADGQAWQTLGSVSLALGNSIYFGTAVASHSPSQSVTAQFRDIGTVTGATTIASLSARGEPLAASTRRTGLVISEIMYHPPDRADGKNLEFFEIFNTDPLAEDLTGFTVLQGVKYAFPAGTILPSGGFLVVAKDPVAVRDVYGISNVVGPYAGALSNDSDVIELRNESGAMVLEAHYSDESGWPLAADGAGHSLVLARPSHGEGQREAWGASAVKGGSPGRMEPIRTDAFENLAINEILAHTDAPELDFVEIYNHSNVAVNLSGCFLSDNKENTNRYTFPEGTTIPARGFVAVDQDTLGFALSAAGETIYLVSSNDVRVIDAVRFEGQANGVPIGRTPDGAPGLTPLRAPTRAAANEARLQRDIVINEIMYNPISGNDDDEYVELYNQGGASADISGWRFTDGINYTFPPGTTIGAGAYLAVAKNATNLLAKYSNLGAANLIGDYDGALANSGERIALSMPDEISKTNEFGVIAFETIYIVVAEVQYGEGGRWGQYADGGGSSLELIDPRADLSNPASWADSNEEAKSSWTTIEYTGVTSNGGISNADQFQMHLQGAGECLVDDVEVRRNSGQNLIANPGFENNATGWVFQGAFNKSTVQTGVGMGGTRALRVTTPVRGDNGANRIYCNLSTQPSPGDTVTLRAKVRWLKGYPEFLLRLRGNWLEAFGRMSLPTNLGTPGQPNSRAKANIGPSIADVSHAPILPTASQAVVVSARVTDPDGINAPRLFYRIDPAAQFTSLLMNDSGTGGDAVAGDGIWSASIPAQAAGNLAAFYVQATDKAAPLATANFPADAPARECLVRWGETQTPGTFATYRIWMTQATIDTWSQREVLNNAPLDVTFVYGDKRVIYNVGALYSGSPFHAGYNSPVGGVCDYVLNFRDDELFLGDTDFVLASVGNLDNDDSAQREQDAFWIGRKLGVPYNNRRYMHLFVNGQRRAKIYEDSQQPNSSFVDGWFPDDSEGELFKIEDWFEFNDGAGMMGNVDARLEYYTDPSGNLDRKRYRWNFRPRAVKKSANDFASFFELVRAANDNTAAYVNRLESVANIEDWMRVFCLEHLVGNWDSYGYGRGKNMFTYRPSNGRWTLMPWDIDFVLGSGSDGPTTDMFAGVNDGAVSKMLGAPAFRRMYFRAMLDAVNGPLAPENSTPVIDARYNALVANGVGVANPAAIKTFIASRRQNLQGVLSQVAATFAIASNNGNNFSTNKNFVTLTGTAPVSVKKILVNGAPYPVTWTADTQWSIAIPLTAASNLLNLTALDLRGNAIAGAADSITIGYTGALTSPRDIVVINEIMYNPLAPDASFIELFNTSTSAAFDLSGFQLDGAGFAFPAGSVIAPGGYMVIAKSIAAFTLAYGGNIPVVGAFSGSLDNGGERLKLVKPGATPDLDELIDVVRYDDDLPWPAAADGAGSSLQLIDPTKDNSRPGNWAANAGAVKYTPGSVNNVKATLAAFPALWINEVLPNNTDGATDGAGEREPWIELYNSGATAIDLSPYFLTDNYADLRKWPFPAGTSLNPGQFLLVWADNEPGESVAGAPHTNFRLAAPGGSIALTRAQASGTAVMDFINYNITSPNRSFGSWPDGQNQDRQLFHFPTPQLANDNRSVAIPVRINEWMAGNSRSYADPVDRQFEDWFELYNSSNQPVDLSGYYLTDTLTNATKFRIPPGYVVPANGYLIVWADEETNQNTATNAQLHVNFKLSAGGEELGLFGADGAKIDGFAFGPQTDDISEGRFPDGGAAPFFKMPQFTPGAPNLIPSGNQPPSLTGVESAIIPEGAAYTFTAVGTDADAGQTLTYSLTAAPSGAQIDAATGQFTWTPSESQGPGNFTFTVVVTDNGTPALSRSKTLTLTVNESNLPPALGNLPDREIAEGAPFSFQIPATDPDLPAQPLLFALVDGPVGATVNGSSGRFDWTPPETAGGSIFPVTVRVTDGSSPALSDTKQFTITVREVNSPPTLAEIADQYVVEGETLAFAPAADDTDLPAQTLTFSLQGLAGAAINPATGQVTWTPASGDIPSTNVVTLRVTDSGAPAQSAERVFRIIAVKSNHAPTFAPLADQTIPEEAAWSLTLQAEDVDTEQTLTYALEGENPTGVTLSSAGVLAWQPTELQGPSTNQISFKVTDNGAPARSVSASVNVIVTEVNRAPVLPAVANQNATPGEEFAMTVSATDADRPNNTLAYSLEPGAPSGATIDANTGRIAWTPTAADTGATRTITVRVTDNGSPALSDTKSISILVKPPVTWKFVSVTGTASSSTIYVYLESPGQVIMDDLQLVAGSTPATGPNLLPNGDFESPLTGPWIVSNNHINSGLTNVAKSGASGLRLVATVGGTTRASSIYQDIVPALTSQATYTISYWYVPSATDNRLTVRLSGNGIVASTSILEQTPPPKIDLAPTLTAQGEIQFVWASRAGVVYRVYYREDIANGAWQTLPDITASGATTTFRAPANAGTARYFKVVALP